VWGRVWRAVELPFQFRITRCSAFAAPVEVEFIELARRTRSTKVTVLADQAALSFVYEWIVVIVPQGNPECVLVTFATEAGSWWYTTPLK